MAIRELDELITTKRSTEVARLLARVELQLSRSTLILVGLTLAGAVLRVYVLADKSIWLDEAFSIALAQHDLGELLRLTVLTDTHPPLYYVVLKFWMALGSSEGVVRLLSVLFSTAAIPLMYLLGDALYRGQGAASRRAGLLAATILAFSPFQIWYAQEARMYAMLTFFVLASALFLVRALRDDEPRDWAGYAATTALALYTDNGAIWYVVAVVLFFVLSRRRFAGRTRNWLLSHGAILLLYAPWLPSLARQTQQVTESFWLPPPSVQTVLDAFLDFNSFQASNFEFGNSNFLWMALSVLYMTMVFVWAYLVPDGGWQRRLATMCLFVPLVVSLLLSLRQPIFLSRNLIAASLGFYLLVVDTIHKFDSTRATLVLLAPLLLLNVGSIGANAWREEKEDWRGLAERVAQSASWREGALILFLPYYAELPFSYYFEEQELSVETQGYPQDELLLHPDPQEVEHLETLLAERPVVWLVLRDVETVDPDWEVKAWLDSNGYVRGPQFEDEEIAALSYIRWDLATDGPREGLTADGGGQTMDDSAAAGEGLAIGDEGPFSAFMPVLGRAVPVTPTPEPAAPAVHVIAPGDTLWVLARHYGTSVEAIMQANGITNVTRLRVGQELIIPVPDG